MNTSRLRRVLVISIMICSFYWKWAGVSWGKRWCHVLSGHQWQQTIFESRSDDSRGAVCSFVLSNKSDQTAPEQSWWSRWAEILRFNKKQQLWMYFFPDMIVDCLVMNIKIIDKYSTVCQRFIQSFEHVMLVNGASNAWRIKRTGYDAATHPYCQFVPVDICSTTTKTVFPQRPQF